MEGEREGGRVKTWRDQSKACFIPSQKERTCHVCEFWVGEAEGSGEEGGRGIEALHIINNINHEQARERYTLKRTR